MAVLDQEVGPDTYSVSSTRCLMWVSPAPCPGRLCALRDGALGRASGPCSPALQSTRSNRFGSNTDKPNVFTKEFQVVDV